jgi:DNA-binding GntR family transcriptional regulator
MQLPDLSNLAPIVARDMTSMIVERIRELIAEGNIPPGSQLTEAALAQAFGVSRGPVREAFQRLTQEGLLRSGVNKGTFVSMISRADVEDIYLVRGAIELAAMEKLMKLNQATVLEELDALLDRMQDAVNAKEYDETDRLDLAFHQHLVQVSGSRRLAHAFDTLSVETRMCLHLLKFSHPAHLDDVEWHRSFVRALRARDPAAAKEAVAFHNATVLEDLFSGAVARGNDKWRDLSSQAN